MSSLVDLAALLDRHPCRATHRTVPCAHPRPRRPRSSTCYDTRSPRVATRGGAADIFGGGGPGGAVYGRAMGDVLLEGAGGGLGDPAVDGGANVLLYWVSDLAGMQESGKGGGGGSGWNGGVRGRVG